ncbi:DNA-directed RNA polymerase, mitochondrial isoform X1 [Amyelois transitella]|uniref:DNA-directed RNA polymerase, mitochondrial isoform X1 n=1 Tax=Amyelois transitella TaxID=680683 RepID=UPI00298F98B4|nr:DNA-directed RNA polymerase, mitochondrial isoform X1 [Amyelois transitella]
MHRLISAKNIYRNTFHGLSLPGSNSLNNTPISEIQCAGCRKILLTGKSSENLVRHQSTRTVSVLRSSRKKTKHKNYKKYGELLEVGNSMTETKVSISKLHASHLSKLASSPVSLGQLHQLTNKPLKKFSHLKEVDPELLQSVRDKILKKPVSTVSKEVVLEDDKCALVYTTHQLSSVERFKTKQYIGMVKDSYYNFRKATLYDQRLQDLRYAINEGLNQEFDLHETKNEDVKPNSTMGSHELPKSPHAVFRELFVDNQLDSYDQELLTHITNMQRQGIAHPALEDLCEDSIINEGEAHEDFDHVNPVPAKTLKIKAARAALRKKKKAKRDKRRALQELNMKEDMKDLVRRGKQDALHQLLTAHLNLLCSLNMVHEGRQILHYYRQKSCRTPDIGKISDVKIYNTLLHGYALLGQIENVKELLMTMSEDGIEPNAQTYAAVFESIERCERDDKLTLLNFFNKSMEEKGINLNDLMDKTKFLNDQRAVVLKAIRRIQPGFEPVYTPPVLDYDCRLLDDLTLDKVEGRLGLLKSPAEGVVTLDEIHGLGKLQLDTEIKGEIEVENIDVKDESSPHVKFCREKWNETESEWRVAIREAFVRNLGTLKSQSVASQSAITLYPYLRVLEVDQFVELIMGEIRKLVDGSETYSPTLKLLQRDLGTQVYQKYQIEQYRRNGVLAKMKQLYAKYSEWYITRNPVDDKGVPYNCRQAWQVLAHTYRDGASIDMEEAPWPLEMKQNVGKFLYNIIINDVKIDVNMFKPKAKQKKLPGVYKVHRPWGRLVRLELKPHPALSRAWAGAALRTLRVRAATAPARAPPRPWARPAAGAYLLTHTPLIRMPMNIMSQWRRLEEAPPGALYPVLDSLNQLSEVPWVINQPILDLQLQIFRSGGNKKLDIPPPSSALDASQFTAGKPQDAAAAFKRRVAMNRARAEMHSLWCDMLYKLSLANHFRDRVFWLPHNMDFRGRVYACPPHVSALGADSARALLQFARRERLGPGGLRWLKLHAVNLTGTMKKSTVDERLAYAESIMEKILDSADNPLDGEGWWQQSEEPWQTLACCKEIANAVRSPNAEEYMCGFPVHQDGSCNGLQHYAALGGDGAGAAAVNLAPAARPGDVYSAVAALVEEMRKRDAAAGVQPAIILENFVRRKVIKQTVMTTVYGVTRFGARLQIAKQLKDIDEFPKEHVWSCSQYLTTKTFDSLQEMFTSTKLIQDWFTDCAKVISGVCGESVEWVTPLGLPVVQPYHRRAAPDAAHAPLDLLQRPCTMKQRNAFPPNFIHSLDSSHMMLTGLACAAAGLTFVSVHDCFWTHPRNVDRMNKICREQFVALHSQPILENLSEFLVNRYSYNESEVMDNTAGAANKRRVNALLKQVPSKGNFDLTSVLKSVYFFS